MIRGIDHLVVAVEDPDGAATVLETRVGLLVTGGGRHERFGTRNRLAFLADGSYLELIGVEDEALLDASAPGRAARRRLASDGEGLAAVALVDDDLPATVERLRATTSSVRHLEAGSRRRADGELVEWRAAFPDAELRADESPFLIEHEPTGAEWGAAAVAARSSIPHPIGGPVRLVRVDIAADEPAESASTWERETGLRARAEPDLAVIDAGRHVVRFRPRREMAVDAVVTLSAAVSEARTVDAAGVRWALVPALEAPRATAVTSGTAAPPSDG